MKDSPELLSTLEELLVQEFRVCQSLQNLTREERKMLADLQAKRSPVPGPNGDVSRLAGLVEEKEILLDQLGRIEDERRMIVQDMVNKTFAEKTLAGKRGVQAQTPTLADVIKTLHAPEAGRISRLQEGITTLAATIREMTSGNLSLAGSALERADAVQAFLLNLYRPEANYQPPGFHPRPESSIAWEFDQKL